MAQSAAVSSALFCGRVGVTQAQWLCLSRSLPSSGAFGKHAPRLDVLSKKLRISSGENLLRPAYQGWVWSTKAHDSKDNVSTSPVRSSQTPSFPPPDLTTSEGLVGEDAAAFDVSSQKTSSWLLFTAILGVVLAILYVAWIDPETGYGGAYIDSISALSDSHERTGKPAWSRRKIDRRKGLSCTVCRIVSPSCGICYVEGGCLDRTKSTPTVYLVKITLVYFINHRYDGVQLWDFRSVFGVREMVWAMSFISFFFLYPSTFNLLEVAAVDKPKVHMWETGIMRITRHPQMVGQFLWCFAHTLWIGNSFTVTTSVGLLAHHLFGVWHGDKRQSERHGEAYNTLKERTSVFPFAAILDGRQKLPPDYYKEFLRVPYFVIAGLTLGAYWSQPFLQRASQHLRW
ncbi:15-cis-zeta-carotene isomerase, chloroplastic isoform X1 [Physcomitrium patens]|uniref:15-cis-zeta-carotene isomerase, chloroplastic isoform X1 n=1 Tax=Physcomitrium patens TaxID=3218 RepID=UPI000D155D54|nr:15-cis-zeta-carotene isomerase, chloroplastic-like isoform X1 [Physcomitrium patens]|eukprot:XP_024399965.1 15-cis-zeta-carotene isomerase, chloroplastic-like isoform X1 [Physcomitrella patens]